MSYPAETMFWLFDQKCVFTEPNRWSDRASEGRVRTSFGTAMDHEATM
ncbi:hypothetical protein [uncultured Roseobacter sp.]|nr:hypothetical protein [uncultured Roseobacter sp.]